MTSSDKTSEQLVASIRKSKSSAESSGGKPAADKTTSRRRSSSRASSAKVTSGGYSTAVDLGDDAFQFGRRVWPD